MANTVVTLTVPSSNTAGAAVSTAALGAEKTVVVDGNLNGVIRVEVSLDGTDYEEAMTVTRAGSYPLVVVAQFMRASVVGYLSGSATLSVAAQARTNDFFVLAVPAADGAGASVDVSGFGQEWTLLAKKAGAFNGTLQLEISQDNTHFAPIGDTITDSGLSNAVINAAYVRIRREGYDRRAPGPMTITVGIMQEPAGSTGDVTVTSFPINNIVDFGAAPGNTAAQNRTAIQAAIDDAVANGIAGILIPGGVFKVARTAAQSYSANLTGISDFLIWGLGPKSILMMSGDADGDDWNLFESPNSERIWIEGVVVEASEVTNEGDETHAFAIGTAAASASDLKITNCIGQNFPDAVVWLRGVSLANPTNGCLVEDSYFYDCTDGGVLVGDGVSETGIESCYFESNSTGKVIDFVGEGDEATGSFIISSCIALGTGTTTTLFGFSGTAEQMHDSLLANCVVIGGDVVGKNFLRCTVRGNVVTGSAVATGPALKLDGDTDYLIVTNNIVKRAAGEGVSAAVSFGTSAEGTILHAMFTGNIVTQAAAGTILSVTDAAVFKAGNNVLDYLTDTANTGFGIDIVQTTVAGDLLALHDNVIFGKTGGSSGELAALVRLFADDFNMNVVSIADNAGKGGALGVLFKSTTGLFTKPVKVADNVFDVTADFGGLATDLLAARSADVLQAVCIGGGLATGAAMIITQAGAPENVFPAAIGSMYLNRSGGASTTLYVKTSGSGNTGWTAK